MSTSKVHQSIDCYENKTTLNSDQIPIDQTRDYSIVSPHELTNVKALTNAHKKDLKSQEA